MSLYLGLVNIVRPGSENKANAQWGSQGTWEIPLSPLNESGRNKPVEQVPGLWMVLSGIHGNETPASRGGTDRQRKRSHRDGYGKS